MKRFSRLALLLAALGVLLGIYATGLRIYIARDLTQASEMAFAEREQAQNLTMDEQNDQQAIENDKLEIESAQLEGNPTDSAKKTLALDQARLDSTQEAESLQEIANLNGSENEQREMIDAAAIARTNQFLLIAFALLVAAGFAYAMAGKKQTTPDSQSA